MAPGQPARTLKVLVPRQNAQRLGPAVTTEVQTLAREQGILVQLPPPVQEQPSSTATSAENASEWNSLLTSARAERGPQWDVGTQQFLVEQGSELYYDPTPLLEAARTAAAEDEAATNTGGSLQPPDFMGSVPSGALTPHHRNVYQNQAYMYGASAGSPAMNQGTPRNAGMFNPALYGVPQTAQFYGDMSTPPRGSMPDGMRRVTRGMAEESPGMYGH